MRINFGTLPWFSPFRFSTFRTRPGPLHPAVLPMILFVALFFGAAPAWCQLDPNTLQGLTPYASFHGGDLDSVNLGSGKLDIHIPLLSYPQRGGKLRMSFTVRYLDSENYTFKTCNKVGTDCEQGTSKEAGALFVVPDFLISLVATGKEGLTNLDGVQTSDFATHPLLPVSGSTSRSVDATGFLFNSSTNVATDREGTRYIGASGTDGQSVEDVNGNEITANCPSSVATCGWTDTFGRSIPSVAWYTNSTLTPNYSGCTGTTTAATIWSPPGISGGTMTFKLCFGVTTTTVTCTPKCGGTVSNTVLQTIVLPNGTAWSFVWSDGDLVEVGLPTGGTISYTWGGGAGICQVAGYPHYTAVGVATRTVNANDGTGPHTWTYTAIGSNPTVRQVTDPLGNQAVHTFGISTCFPYEVETQYYQGSSSTGVLLKTVNTTYSWAAAVSTPAWSPYTVINVVPTQITTTWANGQVSQILKTYDSGFALSGYTPKGLYGNAISESEYDYGSGAPGPLLRTTNMNYLALGNSLYLANNLLALPSSVQVLNGSGVQVAYTAYGYDGSTLASSGITTQHDSAPPAGTYRGNQTSIARWLNTTGGYLTSANTFFDTGTVQTSTNPKGNVTTFAYSSTYAGALPTTVTNALNQSTNHSYDFDTGLLTSTTDPNSQTTSLTYDTMWRLATASYPDGGLDTITHQETTFPFSATLMKEITSSQNYVTTNIFDGLGRISQNQLASDPQGADYTVTAYDGNGRVASVTNPYRTTSDSTYGITQNQYDALNRTTLVTKPDGSTVSTSYTGNTTTVTDEAGKTRQSFSDGLGRLTEVIENPGGLGYVTNYSYDALDDLIGVVQGGSHNRSFVYDSLKRLTSSTNPETGTTPVAYSYDADSNVLTKTDARGITITYSYDSLDRLAGRTYSNGDPSVSYGYDQVTSGYYNIGRLTTMSDAFGWEYRDYDQMGRELLQQRQSSLSTTCPPGTLAETPEVVICQPGPITKNTSYTYNLDGSLATLTYPSGDVVTYTTDSAGRVSNTKAILGSCPNGSSGSNGLPTTGACYAPQGALSAYSLGGQINVTRIYNQRLQPCWIYATTGTALPTATACSATDSTPGNILDLQYNFNLGADNGNVMGITNNRNTARSQIFTYDQVNRIVSAQATPWSLAFGYDQWANLTSATVTGTGPTALSLSVNANNQITTAGFSYDGAGNETTDTTLTYAYNAESEIKSAGGVNYTYDGDGNRVMKSNGKVYWYGAGREILDESNTSGTVTAEYLFFAEGRVAQWNVSNGAIYYYVEDMLGSSRTLVQSGQTSPCYDADFYPYGAENAVTNTCPQNYKFEGKERDTETGNDDFGARYYSSTYGRFLSADWSSVPAPVPYANLSNPQTLNLYAIVHDNPESFADLDGHRDPAPQSNDPKPCPVDQGSCPITPPPAPPPPPEPDLLQLAAQATREKLQAQIAQQNGPAPGTPEYLAKVSGKVETETDAMKKYILAPAAAVEAVGVVAVVGTSAAAEVAVHATGQAVDAAQVAVATHPQEVQVAQGALAAVTHSPAPRTPAGFVGYYGVKAIQLAIKLFQ